MMLVMSCHHPDCVDDDVAIHILSIPRKYIHVTLI